MKMDEKLVKELLNYYFAGATYNELTDSEKTIVKSEEEYKKILKWINNE
jgi:hypothetical protein